MTNNINEQKDEVPFENVASLEHLNRKKHDDNYQDRKKDLCGSMYWMSPIQR